MKKQISFLLLALLQIFAIANANAAATAKNTAYFELKIYHYTTAQQEATIDSFLQNQYLPFLHAGNLNNIGVFKAISNDTATDKKIYVFIPFKSLKQWEGFSEDALTSNENTAASGYLTTAYNKPAYNRIETIFLKAFPLMPALTSSKLTGPKSERVYELRSYEGPTERYFKNKVKMFNQGGEIPLFARLGFNGVFYSEVVFGSKMPNLMYMTSFENMKSREDHWKTFSSDPEWKTLSGKDEYQHNVSHVDITFLRPTEFSEL